LNRYGAEHAVAAQAKVAAARESSTVATHRHIRAAASAAAAINASTTPR
jgi:hypothetical protein